MRFTPKLIRDSIDEAGAFVEHAGLDTRKSGPADLLERIPVDNRRHDGG